MIHQVYAIRDLKADAYLQPFFSHNNGTAIRSFADACQKEDAPFFKHPSDFALFHLGVFDDVSGSIEPVTLKNLGLAADYVSKS